MNPLVSASAADDTAVHGRTALLVIVNKAALLHNTRHLGTPSVVKAAVQHLQAGADGITVYARPDERCIRARDVHDVRQSKATGTRTPTANNAAWRCCHKLRPWPGTKRCTTLCTSARWSVCREVRASKRRRTTLQ